MSIDDTHHRPDRRELTKGYAIEGFDEYFEEVEDKETIVDFVKQQMGSTSPRTRKQAKKFLKKWGIPFAKT